jgi:hypothetical protein
MSKDADGGAPRPLSGVPVSVSRPRLGPRLPRDEAGPPHVLLEHDGRTCDCKGFLRHGHCKHADAILKLGRLGKL